MENDVRCDLLLCGWSALRSAAATHVPFNNCDWLSSAQKSQKKTQTALIISKSHDAGHDEKATAQPIKANNEPVLERGSGAGERITKRPASSKQAAVSDCE